jgi:hypothetical protein
MGRPRLGDAPAGNPLRDYTASIRPRARRPKQPLGGDSASQRWHERLTARDRLYQAALRRLYRAPRSALQAARRRLGPGPKRESAKRHFLRQLRGERFETIPYDRTVPPGAGRRRKGAECRWAFVDPVTQLNGSGRCLKEHFCCKKRHPTKVVMFFKTKERVVAVPLELTRRLPDAR